MPTLRQLLDAEAPPYDAVAAHLEGLTSDDRRDQCRALKERQLSRLYDLAAAGPALTPELFLVGQEGDQPVRFFGRNSLAPVPRLRPFEKHFRRHDGVVVGINSGFWSMVSGPGYFTVEIGEPGHEREVVFDYTKVPASTPDGWPRVRANQGGLQPFIYQGLRDFNRWVTKDVVIGSATRYGKYTHQFYILSRA